MKTANLAIVFTDIKGFTARTSSQGFEENRRMLRLHDALLMPVFKAFSGRKIKTIGDAFLVVFESPTQAVLCGVAIQDRLWDYNRRVAEADQIHVRVAINMGEVRLEGGDVFGEPVNIAARVEGLADAGEVLFTEAVHLAMNKAEVPSEDHGQHELKGIPEKVRVYRVPRGAYRLASNSKPPEPEPAPDPAASPPYGGLALARIADLPPPDPQKLLENWAELSARGAQVGRRALSSLLERLAALPRRTKQIAGGVVVLVAIVGLIASRRGPTSPVEVALAAGDVRKAEAELRKVESRPQREYLEGRIEEHKLDFSEAAAHYEKAARMDHERAFERLLELTESEQCWARANAATALGRLKRAAAIAALKDLAESKYADEHAASRGLLGALGRTCESKQRAADALRAIAGKSE